MVKVSQGQREAGHTHVARDFLYLRGVVTFVTGAYFAAYAITVLRNAWVSSGRAPEPADRLDNTTAAGADHKELHARTGGVIRARAGGGRGHRRARHRSVSVHCPARRPLSVDGTSNHVL